MGRRLIGVALLLLGLCCIGSGMIASLWFLSGQSFTVHVNPFGTPFTMHFDSLPSRRTATPQLQPTAAPPPHPLPTPTETPRYQYLSCYDCAAEGMEINLWAYDGNERTRIVGSLPHGTRVRVLDSDWSDTEGRYYYRVQGDGEQGWVSENFLTLSQP